MSRGDEIVRAKRAANEQTVAAAQRFELDEVVLLCECRVPDCSERILVETARYGEAPVVADGHV